VLISPPKPYLLNPRACPPLGLLTVASHLRSLGRDVEVVDLCIREDIPEADAYGISVTTPDFPEAARLARELKREHPGSTVTAGGPHATLRPLECLQAGFDDVWVGGVPGDPHPDRRIVDLWEYEFYVGGLRATTMVTAAGCAWAEKTGGCAFCSRPPHDRVRYMSVRWVEEELREISSLGFPAVMAYDDEFFTFPERDEQIVRLIPEHGIEAWRCFLRADYCLRNRGLIELAARNGLREALIGVESGSARILKLVKKGTTPGTNLEAIKFLHSIGVEVKAAMIIGLPSESPDTLRETWEFCELAEDWVADWDFTVFVPMPGSEVYEHPERFDCRFDEKACYTAYKGYGTSGWSPPKVRTSALSPEAITRAREAFERRFKLGQRADLEEAVCPRCG